MTATTEGKARTKPAGEHRPESIGYVRAKSTDIFVDPAIQPNHLSHEVDQRALVGGVGLARRLLGTPQLSCFVDRETFPGDGVRTDDEVLHWARRTAARWHLAGTCRMGPATDNSNVVSDELRVHGLQNLRMIDASVGASRGMRRILFTLPADFPHGGISNIPGILMKDGETTRGMPLHGVADKVRANFFLIGLSSADVDMQRNVHLLREQFWFDIPGGPSSSSRRG